MSTSEKPRDVSGVELLMNNHQGHKAEIDAREDNYGDVYSLGKVTFVAFLAFPSWLMASAMLIVKLP
jgi:hypothetical protein